MKKILLIISALAATMFTSCDLETAPSDSVSTSTMLETTEGGMQALNGTYRWFWAWGQTVTANQHQSFGPQGYALMGDLMGEDMVMSAQGNGWFWYDYLYNVKGFFTSSAWRPYDCWNYYYTIISQVNYILAAKNTMEGPKADLDYILANCYALRAYSLHYLALTYARSYAGHETALSVPIYTQPTYAGTPGNARSTNEEVYRQAMSDIDSAIVLLNGEEGRHVTHIGNTVANGIKARIALHMEQWQTAWDAAKVAATGAQMTSDVKYGYNDSKADDVLWGAEIIASQGTTNPQFLTHMDPDFGGYGKAARKCASKWLYDRVPATDSRKAWWNLEFLDDDKTVQGYQQKKFQFANKVGGVVTDPTTGADHIFMRVPEMLLIEAESAARLGNEAEARRILNEDFMPYRDKSYNCTKTGLALGKLTTDETGSLLEEIILQRRIELWGEYGRIYDIKRLRQGFVRTAEMGHPITALLTGLKTNDPESFDWVLTIPQAEMDANPLMVQNPLGSENTTGANL